MKAVKSFVLMFLCASGLFQLTAQSTDPSVYGEYILENGMNVYITEDFSSAPVRIEYSVRAGISAQSPDNTGFFPLYSRLFKNAAGECPRLEAQCGADSARYIITVPPSQVKKTLEQLAECAFNPVFSDKDIEKELSALKTEIMQYAYSPAGFINSSIDARVFSSAPWKQDSGIYPALFTDIKPQQARAVLAKISGDWYTPQNSALFISGGITKAAALNLAEQTFGKHRAGSGTVFQEPVKAGGSSRRFVLYDQQFSEDITQIVVQYTSLRMTQADIAAAAFNADGSSFKRDMLAQSALNIRGEEYINAAAAHKNGSSRLIFQSLLEKSKSSPIEQAELFTGRVKEAAATTAAEEFLQSVQTASAAFNYVTQNSSIFMDYLAQFWAIEPFTEYKDGNTQSLGEKLLSRPKQLNLENIQQLKEAFTAEEPFVFVLVNNRTYTKYKNAFKAAGYEPVNSKNGSWYTQKLYKNAAESLNHNSRQTTDSAYSPETEFLSFIKKNRQSFTSFKLPNGIPVSVKTAAGTSNALILLSIKGGNFADSSNPGFENVMINAFVSNIQNEINRQKAAGLIDSMPEVLAETRLSNSIITVECAAEDASVCIKCISDALIFGDITPAAADSYVYSVQTQKRISNASPANQLYSRAVRFLYSSPDYRNIFDTEKDILQKISWNDILASYPLLLNSRLFSVVITGNVNTQDMEDALRRSLGQLAKQKNDLRISSIKIQAPDFPDSKKLSVKLRHLFHTDVAAEDAGSMPAVLVPTKEFLDPVQFWLPSPPPGTDDFIIFNAAICRLQELLERNAAGSAARVLADTATSEIHAAVFTFMNAKRTSAIDEIYRQTVSSFKSALADETAAEEEAANIKAVWTIKMLSDTQTNRGTAILINSGRNSPQKYLDDYEKIMKTDASKFRAAAEKYIAEEAPLRLYSADSKR